MLHLEGRRERHNVKYLLSKYAQEDNVSNEYHIRVTKGGHWQSMTQTQRKRAHVGPAVMHILLQTPFHCGLAGVSWFDHLIRHFVLCKEACGERARL